MKRAGCLLFGLLVSLSSSCGSDPPGAAPPSAIDDPEQPGLAFARFPSAAIVNGRFEVWVRINDRRGLRVARDNTTMITLGTTAPGVLRGTLSQRVIEGLAVFNDLSYDRWEPITITASAPGHPGTATAEPVLIRPLMRLQDVPPRRVPTGQRLGPISVELVDGRGQRIDSQQVVTLTGVGDVMDVPLTAGVAVFPRVTFTTPGSVTMVWRSPGLTDLVHGVFVEDGARARTVWLPGARVGSPYLARADASPAEFSLLRGDLPPGLRLQPTGEIHGRPLEARIGRFDVFATPGDDAEPPTLLRAFMPVYPAVEAPAEALDAIDGDGPFQVDTLDEPLPVPSRGTSERLRIYYPRQRSDGAVPAGRLPPVVFHHGAAPYDPALPTLYDHYDHLLRRWASHGFIVATIDAASLVWNRGRLVGASLNNLGAMSENQRAAMARLRADDSRPDHPLAGHVNNERVIAAGHSRGGGAAIITAATEPSVIGAILIKPLDPVTTEGGEKMWNVALPRKPMLLIVGGNDADVPYPMVDFVYERRAAPMAAVTVVGGTHFSSADTAVPDEPGATAGVPRPAEWAITNAYAVAFLKYAARGELGYAPLLFGRDGLSTALSQAGVYRRSDRAMNALVVDDFQDDTAGRNSLDLPIAEAGLDWSGDEPSLLTAVRKLPDDYAFYKLFYGQPANEVWSGAHRLTWSTPGAVYGSDLGALDAGGRQTFAFRARTDDGVFDAGKLSLRLVDGAGKTVLLPAAEVGRRGIGERFSDVLVSLPPAAAAGLDLTALARVELVLDGAGSLLIDDLRFE
jgi:dienelactone hydrolase